LQGDLGLRHGPGGGRGAAMHPLDHNLVITRRDSCLSDSQSNEAEDQNLKAARSQGKNFICKAKPRYATKLIYFFARIFNFLKISCAYSVE